VVLLLDLGDPRRRDAEELRDIAHGQPGRSEFGDRCRCATARLVAELGQGTTEFEGLEGVVRHVDVTQVRRDGYLWV
jgi:hypothetical protein